MDFIHRDNEPKNKIDLSIVNDSFERKYIKEFLDNIREYIIYEDGGIIVVNKPAGIITFASRHRPLGMRDIISKAFDIPNLQPISRLDIVTSGCLVFTKKREDRDFYQRQFREKKVSKSYLAFVEGDFPVFKKGS